MPVEVRLAARTAEMLRNNDMGAWTKAAPDLPDESGLYAWQAIVIQAHLYRSPRLEVLDSFPVRLLVRQTTVRHGFFDLSQRGARACRVRVRLCSLPTPWVHFQAGKHARAPRRSPRRRPAARAP